MPQQFQYRQENGDDLAPQVRAVEETTEGNTTLAANSRADPFDVNGDRRFVVSYAGACFDLSLFEHPRQGTHQIPQFHFFDTIGRRVFALRGPIVAEPRKPFLPFGRVFFQGNG